MQTQFQQAVTRLASSAPHRGTDAGLVADFLRSGDEGAFAELVRRHGPTVLGVCRRFLGATPDADDAFQATFLVLVRRARGTEWRDALGPWLYGVALRVARKARAARARRQKNERQAPTMPHDSPAPTTEPDDTATVVDEELAALPVAYRLPLVLCEIQGLSRRDAARQLGIAEGTRSSRLARGRTRLRERLVRRGVAPAVSGLTVAVPTGLASATVRNATHVLACAVGAVPAAVTALTEGVVKTMIVKWKLAAVLLAACLSLSGFGAWSGVSGPEAVAASDPPKPAPAGQPPKAVPPVAAPNPTEPIAKPPVVQPPADVPPVATIFGDVALSREAFADYLIRKHGKKELEQFVYKEIIAHAFAEKGFTLNPEEVMTALDEEYKALATGRDDFIKSFLSRIPMTLDQWTEDVIVPRVMLARLCKEKLSPVTEAELRQRFDAKFGEQIETRFLQFEKKDRAEARKAYERLRDGVAKFEDYNHFPNPSPVAAVGTFGPLPRTPWADAGESSLAVAKLREGQVSPPVEYQGSVLVIQCERVISADKTRSFDTEKPILLAEIARAKTMGETAKLFQELKRQANPKYHLTFPDPVAPPPAPKK